MLSRWRSISPSPGLSRLCLRQREGASEEREKGVLAVAVSQMLFLLSRGWLLLAGYLLFVSHRNCDREDEHLGASGAEAGGKVLRGQVQEANATAVPPCREDALCPWQSHSGDAHRTCVAVCFPGLGSRREGLDIIRDSMTWRSTA